MSRVRRKPERVTAYNMGRHVARAMRSARFPDYANPREFYFEASVDADGFTFTATLQAGRKWGTGRLVVRNIQRTILGTLTVDLEADHRAPLNHAIQEEFLSELRIRLARAGWWEDMGGVWHKK